MLLICGVEDNGDGGLEVTGTFLHSNEWVLQSGLKLRQTVLLIGKGKIAGTGREKTVSVLRWPPGATGKGGDASGIQFLDEWGQADIYIDPFAVELYGGGCALVG